MVDHGGCFGVYAVGCNVRRIIAVLLDHISLLVHRRLWLSCFANLNALVPGVLEVCVASSPALSEPRTATSATTEFAGFRDGATCEAHGSDGRRCSG